MERIISSLLFAPLFSREAIHAWVTSEHLGRVHSRAGAAAGAGGLLSLGIEGLWDLGACAIAAEAPAMVRAHQRPIRRLYAPLCRKHDNLVVTRSSLGKLGSAKQATLCAAGDINANIMLVYTFVPS